MRIEDHVRWSIYNYPSLYRVRGNPSLSRLHVLEALFCTIGNGYEWDKSKRILACRRDKGRKTLPRDFFEKELYSFVIDKNRKGDLHSRLTGQNIFHYFKKDRFEEEVIVEANKENAVILKREFNGDHERRGDYVHPEECDFPLTLYPMCEYSAIVELINGKTNSLNVENYSLDDFPPPREWIDACGEVAIEGIAIYSDPDRSKHDHYSPRKNGMTPANFKKYCAKQVGYCKAFLDKFSHASYPEPGQSC
jgi:hypothetical protein